MQIVQFSESGGFLTAPVIQKNDQTFGKSLNNTCGISELILLEMFLNDHSL